MILYHTTHKSKLRSILRRGLLASMSQGKLPAVWLHTEDKVSWAFLHCVKRHGGKIEDVVTLRVHVEDCDVKRSPVDGLFYTLEDVPPECVSPELTFKMVAASPLENQ